MYCLKLYLLYLIIIALRATGKISLLLLTVLLSWNKVITYLLNNENEQHRESLNMIMLIIFFKFQQNPV